jgi:glutathione S-transferase
MESSKIVAKVEQLVPSPPLHLDLGLHEAAAELSFAVLVAVIPDLYLEVEKTLNEPSRSFFVERRCERAGVSSFQELQEKAGGEKARPKIEAAVQRLREFLKENKRDEGPFVLGGEVSYADLVVVALLEALERGSRELYELVVGDAEELRRLHEACRKWAGRDD